MLSDFDVVETLDRGGAVLYVESVADPVDRRGAFEVRIGLQSGDCPWARRDGGGSANARAQGQAEESHDERDDGSEHHGSDVRATCSFQRSALERYLWWAIRC